MSRLNGRLKAIEESIEEAAPLVKFWYQELPLQDFAIHIHNRGIRPTNQEWTALSGLPFPHNLPPAEAEAHLIELALSHDWPDEPQTPLDYLVDFFTWVAIRKGGYEKS